MEVVLAVVAGLPMTLVITAGAFAIGMVGSIPLLLATRSGPKATRWPARFLVDVIRAVPPLVWLFFIFFGISIGRARFTPLSAAVIGLGVISSAYICEIFRGGLQSVPKGQLEAANALGLTKGITYLRVIAPQVFRVSLPALTSYSLALFKDSSLAATIGAVEMVFRSTAFMRQHPEVSALMPFLTAAAVYAVISVPVALLSRRLDARMSRGY